MLEGSSNETLEEANHKGTTDHLSPPPNHILLPAPPQFSHQVLSVPSVF